MPGIKTERFFIELHTIGTNGGEKTNPIADTRVKMIVYL